MNKTYNIINIIILAILAYAIVIAGVSADLKKIAWVLWTMIVVFSLFKFHVAWKKRKMRI